MDRNKKISFVWLLKHIQTPVHNDEYKERLKQLTLTLGLKKKKAYGWICSENTFAMKGVCVPGKMQYVKESTIISVS